LKKKDDKSKEEEEEEEEEQEQVCSLSPRGHIYTRVFSSSFLSFCWLHLSIMLAFGISS
jgi:hypothetical protein